MTDTRLYRPSNGSEGECFHEAFCYRCQHETDDNPCDILTRSFIFDIGEDGYPREWVEDDVPCWQDTNPRCTAFVAEDVADSTHCADSRQIELPLGDAP